MVRIIMIGLSIFLMGNLLNAQGLRAYEKAGEKALEEKNYRAAYELFLTVYEVDKNRHSNLYKFAEAARMYKAYDRAEEGYKRILESNHADKYPLARFGLGLVMKSQGKYDVAWTELENFILEQEGKVDEDIIQTAKKEIEECKWARDVVRDAESPILSEIIHLDTSLYSNVNTKYTDFGPYWINGKLYYSSLRFENETDKYIPPRPISRILLADVDTNAAVIQRGDTLGGDINVPKKHTAHTAFSKDRSRLYFTICEYKNGLEINCKIYFRNQVIIEGINDTIWGEAIDVGELVNLDSFSSTQPNIGYDEREDREILYFVSNRDGGRGGLDIWFAPLDENGKAIDVQNLDFVNTDEDDITPFYDNKYKFLYFSSNGHRNIGGFDINRTKKRANGWGEITHLGYPLNSSYDDTHFFLDSLGVLAFFSSNREGVKYPDLDSKTCCPDIFSTSIDQIEAELHLLAFCNEKPLRNVAFLIKNLDSKEEIEQDNIGRDTVKLELELDQQYEIIAIKNGFGSDTFRISTYNLETDSIFTGNINLLPDVDLIVRTYDNTIDKPLNGVTVKWIDEAGEAYKVDYNPDGYEYEYDDVEQGAKYTLRFSKKGYLSKTITTEMPSGLCEPYVQQEKVSLVRVELDTIKLYFDNDKPGPPRRGVSQSNQAYDEAWKDYYNKRRPYYYRQYQNPTLKSCIDKFDAQDLVDLELFFENEVKGEFEKLKRFKDVLSGYLDQLDDGQKLIIYIRGYASPRAKSDYNQFLTDRRIDSVIDYLEDIFSKYQEQGKLEIKPPISLGETESKDVPDEEDDKCTSEYSVKAARSRRVEILGVEPTSNGKYNSNGNIDKEN